MYVCVFERESKGLCAKYQQSYEKKNNSNNYKRIEMSSKPGYNRRGQ